MNHIYKTVFNKSTQTWMAVCEYARSVGCGSASGGSKSVTRGVAGLLTFLSFAVLMALQSAHANTPTTIIADKSADKALQPIVLNTASGVVSVNIATPNARGLSNNHYSQFDVSSTGAVLNNNRKAVNTQIAGFVAANPYMARGEASTILNQVNSNNPSHLNGFIEVAGKKADVIIANPSGLVVNGAGFINAGNVHLAAANSQVNQGQVTGYEVGTGHIATHGKLNLQGTDYATLIAKAVQINDEIYAGDKLDVITGENQVSLQDGNFNQLSAVHQNNGVSSTSQQGVALDISNLGGMYAGKIHLIGTDKGFGVNNQGVITATGNGQQLGTGTLTLDSQGNLVNTGKILAKDAVTINTHDNTAQNDGTLLSEQADIAINTASLNNTGIIHSTQTAKIAAKEAIENLGSVYGGVLQVDTGKLTNTGQLIQTGTGKLDITTDTLINTNKAVIGQSLYGQTSIPAPSTPSSDQGAGSISSEPTDNTVTNPQPPALSDSGANTQTKPIPTARGHITATSSIHNTGSQALITATGDIGISADKTSNTKQASIDVQSLNTNTLVNTDSKIALDDIRWQLTRFDNSKGSITARNGMVIDSESAIINTDGSLTSGTDITLIAKDSIINQDGTITAVKQADITAKELQNGGTITADTLTITQQADYTHTDQDKLVANRLAFTTSGKLINQSQLTADHDLTLNAKHIDNTQAGIINSGNHTQITSQTDITNQGLINGDTTIVKATNTINNLAGGRIYGTHLAIQADTLNNTPTKAANQQTNQENDHHTSPVIAARQRLDIGVNTLNNNPNPDRAGKFNEDFDNQALITSLGSLHIGGSLDDNHHATGKAQTVVNKGATIESGGQMVVGAAVLKNENADWSTWTEETLIQKNKKIYFAQPGSTIYEEHEVHFTNADEASNAIVLLSDGSKMAGGDGEDWYYAIFDQYHLTDHVKTSDPARMVSGQDMLIYGDQLTTGHSQMAAGKNFSIKGDTVKNVSTPGYQLEHTKNENQLGESRDGLYYHYVEYVGTLKNRKGNKHNYLGNYLPPNNLINTYELPILNATINTTPSSAKIDELSTGNDTSVIVDVKDNTITLPNSALYIINADDPNLPLIQTDPAFTDYKQWLSSDYMLKALQSDPNHIHKRLSDGYREQERIKDQYYLLTGRHINTDYSSNEEAFKQLMDNGITHAKQFGYTLGTALTAEQMANLTTDIVWLVKQSITYIVKDKDGNSITKTQDVLVPKLYLRSANIATGALTPDGRYAAMSGKNMDIQLTGNLDNNGNIIAKDTVNINANNVTNDGGVYGNFVAVTADNTIANHGTMYANSAMRLDAGNQIINQSQTATHHNKQGQSASSNTAITRIATIRVGDGLKDQTDDNGNPLTTLNIQAGNYVLNKAANIQNDGGNTQITAQNGINITTLTTSNHINAVADPNNYFNHSQSTDVGSTITSAGNLTIATTGKGAGITATAANLQSGGTTTIAATGDVRFNEGRQTQSMQSAVSYQEDKWYGSKDIKQTHEYSTDTAVLNAITGNKVHISSQNANVSLYGTNITANEQASISAKQGDVTIESVKDRFYQNTIQTTQNFYKNTGSVDGSYQETLNQTGIHAGSINIDGKSASVNAVKLQATDGSLIIGNAHLATNPDGTLKLDDNGKPIVISGDMEHLTLGTVDLHSETWQENSKSYRGFAKDIMKGVGVVTGALGFDGITLAKSHRDHTKTETQTVSELNSNHIQVGAQTVTASGTHFDAGTDGFVAVLGDDVLLTTAKHSQTNTQTDTRQTIAGEGMKFGKDHLQLGAVVYTDTTDTQTTQTTTHNGASIRGNSAVVLGNMSSGSLTTQATLFDLDKDDGTLLIGAKNTLLDGAINQVAHTQNNETDTTRIGVTVHHAAVDTAVAAENVKEAIQSANHARKALENAQDEVAAGRLAADAIKDYEANLAIALANVANAQIALGSTAATAASTAPTLGFSAKLGATHTQSQSHQTQTNQDFVGTSITAANATLLGDTFTAKGLQGAIGKLNIDNPNKLTLTHGTTTNTTQNQSSTNTTDASISSTGRVSAGVGRQQSQSHSNTTTAHDTKLVLGEFNGYAEQTTLHGATIIADGGHYSTDVLNVTTSQNHQTQRGSSKGGNIGVGTSSLNLGYNEQKNQSDITTNNAPSGILYVTTGTAGSAHSLTANHTAVTGGIIAAISQDEQGNQTNSPVNFTTNTLTTQDLLATEYSQNTGFGINVGLTRKQGDTKASSIGLSANNSGHNKQTLTLATIGQGTTITDSIIHNNQAQSTTDISQTGINTDALNTQKVIKDQKTGGLDVNTTIDTRVFTTAGRQEIKKEQGEFDGNTKAAFGMFGVAMGATAAGLLDNNENSDSSRLQKIKDNLTQARNNVVTGADKSQASLNAHVDAITDGDLTDALQNQAILNELNAQLTQGTHANGSSVYLTQGTVNDQGQEVKGQANVDRGHTYLNIDYIDTTLETLNHEIAHHNGLGETSATAMGKISDFAYNIGTSLNTDDINTHRQTITPTEKTLQALTTDEQLAITQDNQALLNANEVQRAWEVESGDGVWDQPGVAQGVGKTRQKDCRKAGVSSSDCSAYIWARSVSRAKNIASILVPTSPEEVAFIVVTAGGGYVLKVAGKAGVKVVRSFKGKDELDKAVAEAKRVSRTDTRAGYEPDNDLLSSQASKKARDEKLIKDAENISTAKPNGRPPQVTAPRNIQEQILWSEVVKNPKTAGKPLNGMNNDSRFPKDAGFQKMEAKMRSNDGKAVVIHYQYNHKTNKAYDIKITSVE